MAILPLAYNTALSFVCPPVHRAGFNVATLVPHTNLSASAAEPLTRIVWSHAGYVAECRRDSRAPLAGSLIEGCPSAGLQGFRLGDGLPGLTCVQRCAASACAVLTVPRCVHGITANPVIWRRVGKAFEALRPAHQAMDYHPVESDFVHASHPERKYNY